MRTEPPQYSDETVGLFSMRGRIGRAHYLAHSFGGFIFALLLLVLLGFTPEDGTWKTVGVTLFFIGLAAVGFSEICATVRRLHDLDRDGSQYILLSIPFYNIYLGCLLLFKRGTVGANSYGTDPVPAPFHERPVEAVTSDRAAA